MNDKLNNRKLNDDSLENVAGGMGGQGEQGVDDFAARRTRRHCPNCNAGHPQDTTWFEVFSGGREECTTPGCGYTYYEPGASGKTSAGSGASGKPYTGLILKA
ncbi:MAG: hypothetical protein K5770_05185 [Lachnospiraceae bacterium]|nr:hypothetical protein [Lachnospiraceae bacterium]